MAEANILEKLNKVGSLDNMLVYGKVRCAIKKPNILGKSLSVQSGYFGIIDVFAVKCLKEDYFGMNPNSLYFTRGSMVMFMDSLKWVGKVVKLGGTSFKYGVKVKQQFSHNTPYDGIIALSFQKTNDGFSIVPNIMVELGEKESEFKMTPFEDFLIKMRSNEAVEYPVTLDSIVDFEGVNEYEEIPLDEEKIESENTKSFEKSDNKIDVTKIKLNLEYHLTAQDVSEFLEPISEDIENMKDARQNYAKYVYNEMIENYNNKQSSDVNVTCTLKDIYYSFIDNILSKYTVNIGKSSVKGKYYADLFVSSISEKVPFDVDETFKMPSRADLAKAAELLLDVIQMDANMLKTSSSEDIKIPSLSSLVDIVSVILSVVSGVSLESIENNYNSCNRNYTLNSYVWLYNLLLNPYQVAILGSSLSVVDCDIIYFSITRFFLQNQTEEEISKTYESRSDLLFLLTLENFDDKNSFVRKRDFKSSEAYYPKRNLNMILDNGFPAKYDIIYALSALCGYNVCLSTEEKGYLLKSVWYTSEREKSLLERGIINSIELDDGVYLALERDIEKEVLMYKILIEKGHEETGITEEQVKETIKEFEEEKGFPLEALQKEGIKLCMFKAAVLSGCAGSGKTTTSDCITLCLKKFTKDYKIIYGTPTGKACRRLAEVVGGTVKTLHSQFGVGFSNNGYLSTIKPKYNPLGNTSKFIYILDEMAMCNMDLLYEVVRSLTKDDMIFFLGDCKQLPPIGRGNPFFLLMKILPCVELGVSKRAAEGSQVNYNTTLINCMSDGCMEELYYDDKTFFCRECSDAEISHTVVNVWKSFMDGTMNGTKYAEDDIQVISGYATEKKTYSSGSLNQPIQSMLRNKDKLLFTTSKKNFYKNDRVIHTTLNSYGTKRYIEVEENTFKEVLTLGIVNGEVGKLKGITRADFTQFEAFDTEDLKDNELYGSLDEEDVKSLLDVREKREDKIRDDTRYSSESFYFAKVEVYDTDLRRNVIVLYPARVYNQGDILLFTGEDINNLDLSYALTTHKMQGSQSPVVILPFGSDCSPTFVNRNMINTMVTRSQGVVCMIGSVLGEDSPVNRGRRCASPLVTKDIISFLSSH